MGGHIFVLVGTTLLLTVLDSGTLWVANVGDSRGVMANMAKASKEDEGAMKLLSYDHKPSQVY